MNGSTITTTSGPMNRSGAYRQRSSYLEDIMSESLLMNCSLNRKVYEFGPPKPSASTQSSTNITTGAPHGVWPEKLDYQENLG